MNDRPERTLVFLAILSFLLASARYIPYLGEPFGEPIEDRESVAFVGNAVRNWQRFGFFEHGGRPITIVDPTTPPKIGYYLNHPPGLFWVVWATTRALGVRELSIRLFPAFTASLAIGLFAYLVGRRAGPIALIAAAMSALGHRAGFFFGSMANYESPVTAIILLAFLFRDRARAGAREWPIHATIFLGMWFDWAASFGAVAIAIADLFDRERQASLKRSLRPLVGAVSGGVSYFILLAYWCGSVREALAVLSTSSGSTGVSAKGMPALSEWLAAQKEMLIGLFGTRILFAAAAGFSIAVAMILFSMRNRRSDASVTSHRAIERFTDLSRTALFFLIPGVLNVAVFPRRAFDHEFWWYYAWPAVSLAAAIGVAAPAFLISAIVRRSDFRLRLNAILILMGAFSIAWPTYAGTVRRHREESGDLRKKYAQMVNRMVPADAVLLSPFPASSERFYFSCFVFSPTGKFEHLSGKAAVDIWRSGRFGDRRAVIFLPKFLYEAEPDLADYCKLNGAVNEIPIILGRFVFFPSSKDAPPIVDPKR